MDGGVGAQRPFGVAMSSKRRVARARTRGQNPLVNNKRSVYLYLVIDQGRDGRQKEEQSEETWINIYTV